jgi:hypothetical protein
MTSILAPCRHQGGIRPSSRGALAPHLAPPWSVLGRILTAKRQAAVMRCFAHPLPPTVHLEREFPCVVHLQPKSAPSLDIVMTSHNPVKLTLVTLRLVHPAYRRVWVH